jgi:filamentous hemagglutinin family protein
MKRHASLNRCYRLIWSTLLNTWVAVAETARGRGKAASRKRLHRTAAISTTTLASLLLPLVLSPVIAAPVGGEVVSGNASISQTGNTTNIVQSTTNATLNWQGFNIAPTEVVNFVQPSASAIAVNRIMDSNGTQILGQLNANGQVYLINPNGILFGAGSQVNVGSLVASTLDFNEANSSSNSRSFSGNGIGHIINQGNLHAADGGYIALLGNSVSNQGVITAQLGTVALGGGSATRLTFSGNQLLHLQVEQSTLDNLAENRQLIQADGGRVFMSAGASNSLLASVVNNSGIVQAQTVVERDGQIILMGGMSAGTTNVAGSLDASAPHGGNGGFIETSAAKVNISNDANITTAAATGLTGSWLIDPVDFTVAASGGNITGASLSSLLNSNSISIQTAIAPVGTATNLVGSSGNNGDIFINDAINWTAATSLTLNAFRNININQSITATNATGSLALLYGQGAPTAANTATYNVNAPVNLQAGQNFSTKLGNDGTVIAYNVINSLGAAADATGGAATLQGMAATANLVNPYALGSNIDATATASWNSGAGFTPIGSSGAPFLGIFDGLGHSITNLSINRPGSDYVGLFGSTDSGSAVSNIGLVGTNVRGLNRVGGLVGAGSYSSINNSYASGNVIGTDRVGGLIGSSFQHRITSSYASGSVTGNSYVGGLIGRVGDLGKITNSYASANVSGNDRVGGLTGGSVNYSVFTNIYASGSVDGVDRVGGLVGEAGYGDTLTNSYATGSVSGSNFVGGLAGLTISKSLIDKSYASGSVTGTTNTSGFVGRNDGAISNSFWDMQTSGQGTGLGSGPAISLTGLSTAQMLTQANFTAATTANGNANPNWDFNNTWYMVDSSTRPFLRMEYSTKISNAHQLQLMGMDLSANYTLANNLNLAAELTNPSGMWGTASASVLTGISSSFAPIGDAATPFSGSFDGLGHTISNLTINRPASNDIGLFGATSNTSSIQNIGLLAGSIYGFRNIGSVAGSNAGSISNSFASTNAYGVDKLISQFTYLDAYYAGGLVGVNTGSINLSYATGNVDSYNGAGGLVGINSGGLIENSYATGNVTASRFAGGLVGLNAGIVSNSYAVGNVGSSFNSYVGGLVGSNYGSISNSYSRGMVSGFTYKGGLVGDNHSSITSSFWDTQTSGQATSAGGVGLSTAQMLQVGSFSSWGTAIDNTGAGGSIWRIYEGHTAPLLTSFMTSLTLADAPDVSATYTGFNQSGAATDTGGLLGAAATGTNAGFYNGYYSTQHGYNLTGGNLLIAKVTASVLANSGSLTYNGSNQSLTGFTATGLINGDTASSLTGVSATATGKNAGNYTVVASGTDTNYNLTFSNGLLTINPADLTLSGARSYDGSTIVAGSTLSANGVSGETFSIIGLGDNSNLLNQNVQTNNPLTSLNGLSLGASSNGGLAGNYNALSTTGSLFSVSKLALTGPAIAGVNTTYGTPALAGAVSFANVVMGDDVSSSASINNPTFSASGNLNAGSYTQTAFTSLGGTAASNYSLAPFTSSANYVVNQIGLQISGVSASNKVYDGNAVASLSGIASVSALGGDVVTIGGTGSGLFDNANVGLGKAVIVSGYTLGGAAAANYNLLQPAGVTANISAVPTSPVLAPSTPPSQVAMQAEAANARLSKTNVRAEPLLLSSSMTVIREADAALSPKMPAISVFSHGLMQSLQQPVMSTSVEPTLYIMDSNTPSLQTLPWYARKADKKM